MHRRKICGRTKQGILRLPEQHHNYHAHTYTREMVQGAHKREYRDKGGFPATLDATGTHNHFRTLPRQTPEVMQSHWYPHHRHWQNLILRGPDVCKQTFHRGGYDEVRDDTKLRQEQLYQDALILHQPLRHVESVLIGPRGRKWI